MRTTTQTDKSTHKVELSFFMNGWTLSYFNDEREIYAWVNAMEEAHGIITHKNITEVNIKG